MTGIGTQTKPCRVTNFLPHKVQKEKRSDGSLIIASAYPLEDFVASTGVWLSYWANHRPDSIFIAERSGDGWREVTYRAVHQQVRAIASNLLAKGMNADTPIVIMSGNSVNHALLSLAAQYVGIPVVPLAEQYSLIPGAHNRLLYVIKKTSPKLAYVEDAEQYSKAIQLAELQGIEVVATRTDSEPRPVTPFASLLNTDSSADVEAAHAQVRPDTLAKIMFTSGSTSDPKGVCTTHKMLCSNQTQIRQVFPILNEKTPKILDWLPWNHVFGGGHNFNLALSNGGSLYIDNGKPTPADFHKTLRNIKEHAGNWAFNVPVGFGMLVEEFKKDDELRKSYFADLDIIVYAGASLPQPTWEGIEDAAMQEVGAVPMMISSWGMTETSPAGTYVHEPIDRSGIIGVPIPGFTLKLIPEDINVADRFELRVKGPNVVSSYYNDEVTTKGSIDEEGYFITGDAVKFVDADNDAAGLKFDGRISEDFKLLTGTWVQASILRLQALEHLAPLASDIVICGQDKTEVGVMVFPNADYLKQRGHETSLDNGVLVGDSALSDLKQRLERYTQSVTGSSKRIVRGLILAEPPSMETHEMTGKGNLNARKVQSNRAALVERLYADNDPAVVRI